jgi:hypothetical protein
MGQWYEQPDEDAPYFGEPKGRPWIKNVLWFAVMWAVLAGSILLVAMLAGCTYSGPWKASLTIRYANRKEITSGHAGSFDSGADESDSPFEGQAARGTGASAANDGGLGRNER